MLHGQVVLIAEAVHVCVCVCVPVVVHMFVDEINVQPFSLSLVGCVATCSEAADGANAALIKRKARSLILGIDLASKVLCAKRHGATCLEHIAVGPTNLRVYDSKSGST